MASREINPEAGRFAVSDHSLGVSKVRVATNICSVVHCVTSKEIGGLTSKLYPLRMTTTVRALRKEQLGPIRTG